MRNAAQYVGHPYNKGENTAAFVPTDVHGGRGKQSSINLSDRLLQHHADIQ